MKIFDTFSDEHEQNMVALLYNQNIYYYTYKPVAPYDELLGIRI